MLNISFYYKWTETSFFLLAYSVTVHEKIPVDTSVCV